MSPRVAQSFDAGMVPAMSGAADRAPVCSEHSATTHGQPAIGPASMAAVASTPIGRAARVDFVSVDEVALITQLNPHILRAHIDLILDRWREGRDFVRDADGCVSAVRDGAMAELVAHFSGCGERGPAVRLLLWAQRAREQSYPRRVLAARWDLREGAA